MTMTHAVYRARNVLDLRFCGHGGRLGYKKGDGAALRRRLSLHLQLRLLRSGLARSRGFGVFVSFGVTSRRDLPGFSTRERAPFQRKALPFLLFFFFFFTPGHEHIAAAAPCFVSHHFFSLHCNSCFLPPDRHSLSLISTHHHYYSSFTFHFQ